MNVPEFGLQLVRGSHQFIVHYKDGSLGVAENLTDSLKGRTLDDVALLELHPSGGGQIDKVVNGSRLRGLEVQLEPGVPFPVRVVLAYELAVQVGRNLQSPFLEVAQPGDVPGL